jgi:hypothetical protein
MILASMSGAMRPLLTSCCVAPFRPDEMVMRFFARSVRSTAMRLAGAPRFPPATIRVASASP